MIKNKSIIFFRTDGHEEIGMGHLQRCHNLSSALIKTGEFDVHYFIEEKTINTLEKIKGYTSYSVVSNENAASEVCTYLDQHQLAPSVLVTDGYHLKNNFYQHLKQHRPSLVKLAFDDTGEKLSFEVDGFINTSITAKFINYPSKENILGLDFFPLRGEFKDLKVKARKSMESLLITMGGGDPYVQTERLARIAAKFSFLKEIHLVLGPLTRPTSSLVSLIQSDSRFKLHQAPTNFAELLNQVDFVISAGGSTVHELLFLQVPFATLILSPDQATVLKALENAGFKGNLGQYQQSSDEVIFQKLGELLKTPTTLISKNCQVDGEGITRFCHKVMQMYQMYFSDTFSTSEVVAEYQECSRAQENFEKVKWGSKEGMMNAFTLGLQTIEWDKVEHWLDIGSGTGDFLLEVEKKHVLKSFHGIDLSSELLNFAKSRKYQTGEAHFHLHDFLFPAKELTQFDLVTSIGVLQKCGLPLKTAVARLAEWVKPGGQIFVTTKNADWEEFKKEGIVPYSGHHWFSLLELEAAFQYAGLELVQFSGWEPRSNKIVSKTAGHTVYLLAVKK